MGGRKGERRKEIHVRKRREGLRGQWKGAAAEPESERKMEREKMKDKIRIDERSP